jgi:hypothetical protein
MGKIVGRDTGQGENLWLPTEKRINIFFANFGSGKTELALNYVLAFVGTYPRTALIDIDIINPYFTSRLASDMLEKHNIEVITAPGFKSKGPQPIIPQRVLTSFISEECGVVCDVGGDNVGAVALGQFSNLLKAQGYELFLVVNPFRPLTRNVDDIKRMLDELEAVSRLKATSLASNPNLGNDTSADAILEGHAIVQEASEKLGLRVAFAGVLTTLVDEVEHHIDVPILPVEIRLKKPWE